MIEWLEWARGHAFIFSFTLMILGLTRNFLLTIWGVINALFKANEAALGIICIWSKLFVH